MTQKNTSSAMTLGGAFSGLHLWVGVVEDVMDPLLLGRARVRVFGYHSQNKADVPTNSLPWAHPLLPITSAGMNGIGFSPTGVLPGSHVVGFFRDGQSCQDPVYGWVIGGIQTEKFDKTVGFTDPSGLYPLDEYSGESDTSRLARGLQSINEDGLLDKTIVTTRAEDRKTDIPIANSDAVWAEPEVPYAAEYPHNKVYESESRHVFEIDDTPDAERINIQHTSGTFIEFQPDGSKVTKTKENDVDLVDGKKMMLVKGDLIITAMDNASILVNNAVEIQTNSGDVHIVVKQGDVKLRVENGNVDSEVTGDVEQYITGNVIEKVAGSKKDTIHGNYTVDCSGTVVIRGASIHLN